MIEQIVRLDDEGYPIPIADLVRCRDCKHSQVVSYAFGSETIRTCRALGVSIGDDEFCSYGERKDTT